MTEWQTGQNQYAPDLRSRGHKKKKEQKYNENKEDGTYFSCYLFSDYQHGSIAGAPTLTWNRQKFLLGQYLRPLNYKGSCLDALWTYSCSNYIVLYLIILFHMPHNWWIIIKINSCKHNLMFMIYDLLEKRSPVTCI